MALATSERTSAARLRRMESAVLESIDLRHQLSTTQHEASQWQSTALRTTELVASLHKSIYTLEAAAARAFQHRDDRLAAAERMVTRL